MTLTYKVDVNGLGTVYEGVDHRRAGDEFFYYARESRGGYGNAAGKVVTFSMPTVGVEKTFDPAVMSEIPRV